MEIRRFTLIMMLTGCFAAAAPAQKKELTLGVDAHSSFYDMSFAPIELGLDVGYGFTNWLKAGLRIEQSIALMEEGDARTFAKNNTAGAFACFEMLHFNTCALSLKASGGASLKSDDWKYVYYDSYLCLSKRKGDLGTNVGIGVRYYDSRSEFMDNKLRGYLSIGVSYTL